MSELSREQVEQAFDAVYWRADQQGEKQGAVLDGVDALRATITQQAQELERVKSERDEWKDAANDYLAKCVEIQRLQQQLSASQARLYKYDHWTPEHTIEEWLADRQRIVDAKQVEADAQLQATLAASQARCREMERDTEQAVYALGQLDEKYLQLQATLAAREAVIGQQEATILTEHEKECHRRNATLLQDQKQGPIQECNV